MESSANANPKEAGNVEKPSQREHEQDPKTRALLAMSRFCQEQWVREMVKLHMTRGDRLTLALLSGDAGCGKSYAITQLYKKLRSLKISVVVSAMTNKAAGALMEAHSLERVYTFHKMMGFKKELLNKSLTPDEFTREYQKAYSYVIAQFNAVRRVKLGDPDWKDSALAGHSCRHHRPESCAVCSKMFEKLRASTNPAKHTPMQGAPLFLGANVLIVDEYGLMDMELLERMLCCLRLFYGPDKGPLIIFSGSVSQLQPVGSRMRIWESERFEKLLASSTPLLVNRRQFKDPGYAEALTYLQFNTITEESRRIFRSQVSVYEPQVMDPEYEPDKMRIFHQDAQQSAYTLAYMNKVKEKARVGDKFLSVTQRDTQRGNKGPAVQYEVLKQAAQALPKLFSVPKGVKNTERDYIRVDKLWVGCKVRLLWHMDTNGIRAREMSPTILSRSSGGKRLRFNQQQQEQQQQHATEPGPLDTEGVIADIRLEPGSQYNLFYVRGLRTGTMYEVAPSQWHYMNWTVTTHPLACLVAMNTYECQGCTVYGNVLYHPPKRFALSPIKPSVYVVLSRVVSRHSLQMTNCNFAQTIGDVNIYDKRLVAYRKRVEMSYSS